jgi:pimeloyl-ACP methyl ester carboxylesterase
MNKQQKCILSRQKLMRETVLAAAFLSISLFFAGNIFGQVSLNKQSQPAFKVKVTGKGQPMILIPGLASSGEVWDSTVARYKANYECHVLTLAGFAGEAPIGAPFIEKVRTDIAVYIRTKKLNKPVVVGHSLGGFTALWLASTEPELVGSLVIIDSLPFLPAAINSSATVETMKPQADVMRKAMIPQGDSTAQSAQRQQMDKMVLESLKLLVTDPVKLDLVAGWGRNSDPATVAQAMYEMHTTDLRSDLARIKAPTLVVGTWIGYRQYSPRERVEKVFQEQYAKLAGFQFVMSETGKHFVMYDDPDTLFKSMDLFLAKQKPKNSKK